MLRRPPCYTRSDTLFPSATLCRSPRYQLLQHRARRRCLEIFGDMRLDAGVADHRQNVARGAAFGIVIDDDVDRAHAASSGWGVASAVAPSTAPISFNRRFNAI